MAPISTTLLIAYVYFVMKHFEYIIKGNEKWEGIFGLCNILNSIGLGIPVYFLGYKACAISYCLYVLVLWIILIKYGEIFILKFQFASKYIAG